MAIRKVAGSKAARATTSVDPKAKPPNPAERGFRRPLIKGFLNGLAAFARFTESYRYGARIVSWTTTEHARLFPEPAIPLLIASDSPQEIDLPKRRPVRVAEVELAVGALPEHEARQSHFPTRPDDQVRVWTVMGI
jgi:hypothetical protein